MLPPGHIAAGYLTAQALLHATHQTFTSKQQTELLWWGMFFGFAPDLDTFIAFAKAHSFTFAGKKASVNHRKFFSHAPILWLIAGLLIFWLALDTYWKYVGLLLWFGSWSHFVLDTVQYGIMWLWPFSTRIYAIKDREVDMDIKKTDFVGYWWKFVKVYSKTISFYLEIIIIIIGVISLIGHK